MATWNQDWNTGWNVGFNNPTKPAGQGGAYSTGYDVGVQEYYKRNPRTVGGLQNNLSSWSQQVQNSVPSGGGQVLGTSTQQTTSDPVAEARAAAEKAAQDAYNAQNQQLNTQFDYAKAQLEGQLPGLANQRDQSLGQLDLGLQDVRNQVGTSKTNLQTNTQQQINQAGSTARNVQGQNRNVLRSLGILNSSAAGQILAKPGNQFDEQRAQLGQFLVQKTTELDQYVNQKVSEASQLKNSIVQNYQDLVNKIQTDLRFNERQRNDALQSANAALTQHLSDISMSVMNYKQQADLQKQQIQASLGSVLGYTAPTANLNASGYQTLSNQGQTAQQGSSAAIYEDPNKKKVGGFDTNFLGSYS